MMVLAFPPPAAAQKGNASLSGAAFEDEIAAMLVANGFTLIAQRDWNEALLYENPSLKVAITDAPYISIYGHRAHIEFLLISGERQVLVEAKRQRSRGSVDEKLPFVYHNALANIGQREFVLVMDGDGWRSGARDWIRAKAQDLPGFEIFDARQFADWVAREFGGAD